MGNSFTVRPAVLGDAAAIAHVHVEGWRWAYRGLLPQEFLDGLSVEKRKGLWHGLLATHNPRMRIHVAESSAEIFGFASTNPCRDADSPDAGELAAIYLLKDRQGTGAGRALLDAALAGLRADGFGLCTLWVLDGNALARRFYDRAGFRADGGRKDEPVGGAPAAHVRYRLALP